MPPPHLGIVAAMDPVLRLVLIIALVVWTILNLVILFQSF